MINLQISKKNIRGYEELLPTHSRKYNHTQVNFRHEKSARLANRSEIKEPDGEESSFPFGRTISKMIKIEFHERQPSRQSNEIRVKRKMLTSNEKFQTRKKTNYATSLKQAYNKAATFEKTKTHLAIGTHAIQKMDYNNGIFSKEFRSIEDSYSMRQRLHAGLTPQKDMNTIAPLAFRREEGKVLILKKNSTNRLEELLFKNVLSTNRPPNTTRAEKQPSERVMFSRPSRDGKVYSIQEYIPIRKIASRKQPFVFGLSEKQLTPQRNRERLVLYHDFLWKINYSNGLYIRASEQETTYRAFIGVGNNSNLIKSILKRRYWWVLVDRVENCNFVWTQLKVNSIFRQVQSSSQTIPDKLYPEQSQIPDSSPTEPIASLQEGHERIFNQTDLLNWTRHIRKHRRIETSFITDKTYKSRAEFLNNKSLSRIQNSQRLTIHNHFQQNYYIGNKKSLFYHLKKYYSLQQLDVFQVIPLTFHIAKGVQDVCFKEFQGVYERLERSKQLEGSQLKNIWIMKPGENSNRGSGISVCHSLEDIRLRIKSKERNGDGSLRTFIVQQYMEKPLLYKGRKFDIRHYLLLTSSNGIFKAYWFPEGYVRTSSAQFSLKRNTNLLVHLTNDAVQKNAEEYGKYEKGNKISYQKLQSYLNKHLGAPHKNCFFDSILPEMKQITKETVKATYLSLDPNRPEHNFELLGLDFMIDEDLKPWLIEVNTNPCLELSSPLLSRLIPSMIEQTMRICVDPFFPPPDEWTSNKKMHSGDNPLEENQFQLIFDESVNGQEVLEIFGTNTGIDSNMGKIQEDAELFENEGIEEWEDKPK